MLVRGAHSHGLGEVDDAVTTGVNHLERIQTDAVAMLGVAFRALHEDRVLPTSRFRSFPQVVRDYSGVAIKAMPEFGAFEATLVATYPDRFGPLATDSGPQEPWMCAFRLLEACIARLTQNGESYDVRSPTVDLCIRELVDMLDAEDHEAACCRLVAHLTTADDTPVEIGDLKIIPVRRLEGAIDRITEVIPAAPSAFNRNPPHHYDPPLAVVVGVGRDPNPYWAGGQKSKSIERFLLLTRLLTAGTTHSVYEVTGQTQLGGFGHPQLNIFNYHDLSLLRRTTKFDDHECQVLGVTRSHRIDARSHLVATRGRNP